MNETLTLAESTPFYVKVYAYSIYAISIFVYFIVLSTLCIKYRIDNNVFAHSVYLFYIHTLFLLGEGLIVFSQPIALFPKLAFYLTGPLTRFRLSPHFWLIILFSLFQQLILSTGTCLMYRWLTFNHFRIRTYRVSSGLFHSSFIFHSIINLPFIFLFAISEVPKEAILDDGLAITQSLKNPRIAYYDYKLNQNLVLMGIFLPFSIIYALGLCGFASICIFTMLNGTRAYSRGTKILHRKAVLSTIFMFIPFSLAALSILGYSSFIFVYRSLEIQINFNLINKLIVPSLLGGSLLHSYSTLYTAWSGHVSLFTALNSLAKRKYTPQSQPDLSQKPTRNAREVEFAGIE